MHDVIAPEERVQPHRSDRLWGPGWVVLGAAITVGAWRIDRLASQGVHWFAAPGLLPGVLGIVIALCGVWLALRARTAGAGGTGDAGDAGGTRRAAARDDGDRLPWTRVATTLALCLGFAVLLVGRGLPFGVAAALYLFAHVSLLQWHERGAVGQRVRGLLVAGAVAVGAGLAVPFVFEQLFLVRLP